MEANNMKEMRDALKETQSVIAKCLEILNKIPDSCGYGGFIEDVGDELCYLRDEHVNPALAKPPRECDMGTAGEQTERFKDLCRKYRRGPGPRANCKGCPIQHESLHVGCTFAWSQMPYEEVAK